VHRRQSSGRKIRDIRDASRRSRCTPISLISRGPPAGLEKRGRPAHSLCADLDTSRPELRACWSCCAGAARSEWCHFASSAPPPLTRFDNSSATKALLPSTTNLTSTGTHNLTLRHRRERPGCAHCPPRTMGPCTATAPPRRHRFRATYTVEFPQPRWHKPGSAPQDSPPHRIRAASINMTKDARPLLFFLLQQANGHIRSRIFQSGDRLGHQITESH